jgi:Zn-finger nucleic acid-binding protein
MSHCPVDSTPLSLHTRSGVTFHSCPRCFGLLFAADQLERAVASSAFVSPSGANTAPPMPNDHAPCPRCGEADLETMEEGGTLLHRCPACRAVWLSAGAVESVLLVRRMAGRRRPKARREPESYVGRSLHDEVPVPGRTGVWQSIVRFFRTLFGLE